MIMHYCPVGRFHMTRTLPNIKFIPIWTRHLGRCVLHVEIVVVSRDDCSQCTHMIRWFPAYLTFFRVLDIKQFIERWEIIRAGLILPKRDIISDDNLYTYTTRSFASMWSNLMFPSSFAFLAIVSSSIIPVNAAPVPGNSLQEFNNVSQCILSYLIIRAIIHPPP